MATSGDFYGEYSKQTRLRLHWQYTQETANNRDKFTVTLYAQKPSGMGTHTYGYHDSTFTLTGLSGSQLINGNGDWEWGNVTEYQVGTSTFYNNHNADGTSNNVSISGSWYTGLTSSSVVGTNMSVSGTVTGIPTIPRYATVTQSLNSKTSSSIKINWSSDSTIDYIWYSKNNGSTWTGIDITDGTSGNYTISSLTPNTTYQIKTRVRRKDSQLTTDSTALSVTTYKQTIPTISLSSKTSSSITVSSSCNVAVSSTQYRIKQGSGSYGSYQTSATFTGLSANTSYTIEVKKVASESGESGTATLTVSTYQKTIPTISLSSKTVNSITVTSGCNVSVSSTQYRIKVSGGSYGSYQTSNTFSSLNPNTTYIIEVKKVATLSGESGTATLTVTTYDIAKISSYPNFNLGNNETIQYTNPSGSSLNVAIYKTDGSTILAGYRSASGSSYTFNFTDTELDNIYKQMGTSNSINVRVYIRTTSNNSNYYDYKQVTITLTGNQKTGHVNVSGTYKRSKKWVNVNGTWKRCVRWVNVNGTWKRCI